MEEKFTVAEFKKYLESVDSFGDAHYFCTADKIREANEPKEEQIDEVNDNHLEL